MSLVTLPEEILSSILHYINHVDELGFMTSQRTCRRLRSTIQHLMKTRPETLFLSLQVPDPILQQTRDYAGRICQVEGGIGPLDATNEHGAYPTVHRQKCYHVKPLPDRFGFLLDSDYPYEFPKFKLKPLPFNLACMAEDVFRCMPWALEGWASRERYLRVKASWRGIPICCPSLFSSPLGKKRKVVKRIQVVNFTPCQLSGHETSRRLWTDIRTTTTTTATENQGGEEDNDEPVTLGLLWDLILSGRFGCFDHWELLPGYVVDMDNLNRQRHGSDLHCLWQRLLNTLVRDDETATLLLNEVGGYCDSRELFSVKFASENMESMENRRKLDRLDLWDPEPLGKGKIDIGQCRILTFA